MSEDIIFCWNNAARWVLETKYREYIRKHVDNGNYEIHSNFCKSVKGIPTAKDVWEYCALPPSKNTRRIMLLTVNPPPQYDWSNLLELWNRMLSYKNALCGAEMVLEQRSDDPSSPKGWHMHVASYSTGKTKAQVLMQWFNGLARCLPHALCNSVHFKWCPRAFEYVNGIKGDDTKNSKLRIDAYLREKNNLKHIYKQDDILSSSLSYEEKSKS